MDAIRLKVIYFSPTGNTKKIIHHIIEGIAPDTVCETNATKRSEIEKREAFKIMKTDLIIIGASVYGGFSYKDFRNYLKRFDFNDTPVAIALSYGNASVLLAKSEISSIIKKGNGVVIGYGAFVGEHSFSTTEVPVAKGRPDANDLKQAVLFGQALRHKLTEAPVLRIKQDICYLEQLSSKIADIKPLHTRKRFFTVPYTKPESCSQCGRCIGVCPGACIDKNFQTDKKACIVCMACVKACPNKARITKPKNPLVNMGLKVINKRKNTSYFIIK